MQAMQALDVEQIMRQVIEKSADPAAAIKELVLLQEHQQDRWAKQQWVEAFARVRATCRDIQAVHANPDKQGNIRWWMADLRELLDEIEPLLRAEDMELTFDAPRHPQQPTIVEGVCRIMHVPTGHMQEWRCGMSVGNAQGGDLGAATTAKRGALIAALALKVRHSDDDARLLGNFVDPEMVAGLQSRLRAVRGNSANAAFLALAGADSWEHIRQGKLGILHDWLARAEGVLKAAAKPAKPAEPAGEPGGMTEEEQAKIKKAEQQEGYGT